MAKNLVRFDWAIKRLLRQKANFVILEGFLSELLKEPITIQYIGESEGNKQTVTDKYNWVDVLQNSLLYCVISCFANFYKYGVIEFSPL